MLTEIIDDVFWVDPFSVNAVYRSGTGATVVRFNDGNAEVVSPNDVVADVVSRIAAAAGGVPR